MKKIAVSLIALILLVSISAFADEAEPGLLRTAVLYDISTMDVAETTDGQIYTIPWIVLKSVVAPIA